MELTCAAPIAIAIIVLTLFCLLGLVLIPLLDDELRRQIARLPANDNAAPPVVPPTAENLRTAQVEGRVA